MRKFDLSIKLCLYTFKLLFMMHVTIVRETTVAKSPLLLYVLVCSNILEQWKTTTTFSLVTVGAIAKTSLTSKLRTSVCE